MDRWVALLVERGQLTRDQAGVPERAILALIDDRVIQVIPRVVYGHLEPIARRHVPHDPDDWPPVALSLSRWAPAS